MGRKRPDLTSTAQRVLDKGWYLFGTPYRSKKPFEGSHGSRDARNDAQAMDRWKTNPEANPCIRLDWSGLTVLDADHGLKSLQHAEAWAAANGLPATYIVTTGRIDGGFHFYFNGIRTLPDVTRTPSRNGKPGRAGFELDGVSGDIKCHGHVVAAGGLHKTGAVYVDNGRAIANLPDFLRDYQDPVERKKHQRYELLAKKHAEKYPDIAPGTKPIPTGERHSFLLSEAGRLRQMGLEEKAIYLGLWDLCHRWCEAGEKYCDGDIQRLAKDIAAKPCDRRIATQTQKTGLVIAASLPTRRNLVTEFLRRSFPAGHRPVSIQTILARINTEHPDVPERTCRRAIDDANFSQIGKDPADGRITLWARHGEKVA